MSPYFSHHPDSMSTRLLCFGAFAALAACASTPQSTVPADGSTSPSLGSQVGTVTSSAMGQTRDGLPDAALSSLDDLNLRRDEIPPLLAGMESPYELSPVLTCEEVEAQLARLDLVLGPDWDTPNPDARLRTEILADSAAEATLNMLASEARGFIPFRGLIRRASGAAEHEKKYNKAFRIGAQQRSYLKGYGLARGCPPPARPDFMVQPSVSEDIVFRGDSPQPPPARPMPQSPPSETTLSQPTAPPVQSEGLQTVPPEY
jgi:hypothetical protein